MAAPPASGASEPAWVRQGVDPRYPAPRFVIGVGAAPLGADTGAAMEAAEDRARAAMARNLISHIDARTTTRIDELRFSGVSPRTQIGESLHDEVRVTSRLRAVGARVVERYTDPRRRQSYALVVLDTEELAQAAQADLEPWRRIAALIADAEITTEIAATADQIVATLAAWPSLPERVELLSLAAPALAGGLLSTLPTAAAARAALDRLVQRASIRLVVPTEIRRGAPLRIAVEHQAAGLPLVIRTRPGLAERSSIVLGVGPTAIELPRAWPGRDGNLNVQVTYDGGGRLAPEIPVAKLALPIDGGPLQFALSADLRGCDNRVDPVALVESCTGGRVVRQPRDRYDLMIAFTGDCRSETRRVDGGYSFVSVHMRLNWELSSASGVETGQRGSVEATGADATIEGAARSAADRLADQFCANVLVK